MPYIVIYYSFVKQKKDNLLRDISLLLYVFKFQI